MQNNSATSYKNQIINAVNAGIDMFMEVDTTAQVVETIVKAVGDGEISQERVDDAVTRIIRVK